MDYKEWSDAIDKRVEEERRNYKGPHCCLTMDAELARGDALLHYSQRFREYGVRIPKSTGSMLMDYCMFCGKKFPMSVRDEWFGILENEYGLEWPDSKDKKKVPQEFWTDEWWKERGL
jgi:hypothetical protein